MKKEIMPYWKTKTLEEMTPEEWEALCDGCGRCCLQKLENRKTGKIYYTWVSCYLFDTHRCRCRDYENRAVLVKECTVLTPSKVKKYRWLPKTCAYRLVAFGKNLPEWHPLISGSQDSVHEAGVSIRGKALPETHVHPSDVEYYTIDGRF